VPVIASAGGNLALSFLNYAALGSRQRRARFLFALGMMGENSCKEPLPVIPQEATLS